MQINKNKPKCGKITIDYFNVIKLIVRFLF